MTESPSALLERAAELIAERAVHFAGYVAANAPGISRWDTPAESWSYDAVDRNASPSSRAWIETMNPAVAQPLVEWLRDAARRMELHPHLSPEGSTMQRTALAFARQVLGEPLDHDWFFPYDSHPGARECSRCGAHDDSQPCH